MRLDKIAPSPDGTYLAIIGFHGGIDFRGQIVEIDVKAYDNSNPLLGEVILIKPPNRVSETMGSINLGKWISRIVAIPGDSVTIDGGMINVLSKDSNHAGGLERIIARFPLPPDSISPISKPIYPIQIPFDYFHVVGDNPEKSFDSRFWGLLPRDRIIGKVR